MYIQPDLGGRFTFDVFSMGATDMRFSTSSFQLGTIPFGATLDMGLKHEFEWCLDDALIESGRLPTLNSAPLSSWLIARLRWLDNSLPAEIDEQNDGGGYCFEMAVATGASVVAGFQLQGDMEGVAVLGRAKDVETVNRVLEELVGLLVETLLAVRLVNGFREEQVSKAA